MNWQASLSRCYSDSLEDHAASTDQYCRLLCVLDLSETELERLGQFLCDHERAIHSWQNYHLWLVLARLKYKNTAIVNLAANRIKLDVARPEVAAIFIYLRCVNEVALLEAVVNDFHSSWPYYHQRNYLLATSDFDRELLKPILGHLGPKLRGTAQRAKSHFSGNFPLVERERMSILRIYDDLSPYD